MSTLSRKQREIQQRELLLLDLARKMLIEQGYAGLNMDRLAEAAEYSKGTVYQHFSTKEDLLTAMAFQSLEARCGMFEKSKQFKGRPRERFAALLVADELFAALHPYHYHSELIIKMANLEERASTERRESLNKVQCQCVGYLLEIVEDAIEQGDLVLPPTFRPGDMVFSVLTFVLGAQTVVLNFPDLLSELGVVEPRLVSRQSIHALLDGFQWRPLSTEWDYQSTFQRISKEVFDHEFQLANRVG
jgi:AcrR family transcriptional regulator